MTDKQWNILIDLLNGRKHHNIPIGFIIDSPWLPGWYGVSTLDYYTSDEIWFKANLKAVETFPEVIFIPGFWSEYGMCTEPSAFGSKCIWAYDNLPHADKCILNVEDIQNIKKPNVKSDGLLPFMLNRLVLNEKLLAAKGHSVKFAVSRGPLNIASFLMGTTDFFIAMKTDPDDIHKLLTTITGFIADWITLQMETIKSIDGILLLDDMIGFVGEDDFKEFVLPYMSKIFKQFDVKVKLLHNDADGIITARYWHELGYNMFNFSFKHSISEISKLTENSVVLLGNIPPRDILANGTNDEIKKSVKECLNGVDDASRIMLSCGGGMPQGVTSEKIQAFIEAVEALK